jgi:transposase
MAHQPRSYPSDVSDEEWAFCAPYLTLMNEQAPQRKHSLRAIFNALRWLVRAGCSWRMMPNDLPPWPAVQQQTQRWVRAGSFEAIAHDLRLLLRLAAQRSDAPSAAILDSRTLQSTPESGARAGFDGHKKRKGSKVHAAVDTLGHLLALKVTPANEQDRAQVAELVVALQEVSGENVEVAFVDQGYTGEKPAEDAARAGVRLEVVKHHEAKRGFVLLPRRWVVERTFAWAARFRRLARDYERLAATLAAYHWLALVTLMLQSLFAKSS